MYFDEKILTLNYSTLSVLIWAVIRFSNLKTFAVSCQGETSEEPEAEIPKLYEPIESLNHLRERLSMFLQLYNETIRGTGMDLVFFTDAMVHLVKVQ